MVFKRQHLDNESPPETAGYKGGMPRLHSIRGG